MRAMRRARIVVADGASEARMNLSRSPRERPAMQSLPSGPVASISFFSACHDVAARPDQPESAFIG